MDDGADHESSLPGGIKGATACGIVADPQDYDDLGGSQLAERAEHRKAKHPCSDERRIIVDEAERLADAGGKSGIADDFPVAAGADDDELQACSRRGASPPVNFCAVACPDCATSAVVSTRPTVMAMMRRSSHRVW